MKTIKKIISIVLCLTMVMSLCVGLAYADETTSYAIPENATFEEVGADYIGVDGSVVYAYTPSELINPEPMLMPVIFVYADEPYADIDAAWEAMCEIGLLELAEEEHAAVMMINPVDDTWGEKDVDVYDGLINLICTTKNGPKSRFTFYTYCTMISAIGEGSGATFINQYLSQNCNRLASVALFGGTMPNGVEPYVALPAYISGNRNNAVNYYKTVNETDSETTKENGLVEYYKAAFETQRVVVDADGPTTFDKDAIADAWYYVIRRTCRNALGTPLWNDSTCTDVLALMPRPMVNELDLTVNECADLEAMSWQSRWYEWVPNEVYDTMADPEDDTTYALVMCYHGSGDHPVFEAESNGWVNMAGEERFILVAPETNSNTANNIALINYIIDKYPIDESRIYMTGFSMGCGNTNSTAVAYTDFFAAIAPSANYSPRNLAYNAEAYDLPIYETVCSKDLYATSQNPNRYKSFAAINSELALNEIDITLGSDNPDYITYPFYGFDIFEVEGASTTTVYSAHNVPFNITTFKDDAGVPMVKVRVAMGMDHNHYTEFARDIWNYFECFSRDPETKAVIYNAPEQIVGETVTAKCGEGETAVIDVTYSGDITATTLRFQLDTDWAIADVDSKYALEYNPANGKIVIYNEEGIVDGDVICSITLDLDVSPWIENGVYSLPINVIEATDNNLDNIIVDSVPITVRIINEYVIGDINLDGIVSNADLVELARYLVDLVTLDDIALANADINADGKIGNVDLVKLARMLVA